MRNNPQTFHFAAVDGGPRRRLLDDVKIRWSNNTNDFIIVPAGFYTDFASIPKAMWWLYSPWGVYGPAAVLHDYLYYTTGLRYMYSDWRNIGPYDKRECDIIFEQCMSYDGVHTLNRKAFFYAVDNFGSQPWKNYRDHNETKLGAGRK